MQPSQKKKKNWAGWYPEEKITFAQKRTAKTSGKQTHHG